MVTFFCPECWQVVAENDARCLHCGVDIQRLLLGRDYVDKLIAALRHPESSTPVRAATILGSLRSARAVVPLQRLIEGNVDIYQKAAAIVALGKIADPCSEPLLENIAQEGPTTLRQTAREALRELRSQFSSHTPGG